VLAFFPPALDAFQPVKALGLRAAGMALLAWVLPGRLPRSGLVAAVAAWCGVAVLATALSISPRLSLFGEPTQREGLLTQLALGGLALGTLRSHRTAGHVRATLGWLVLAACLAAAYAQLQLAGLDPIRWAGSHIYRGGGSDVLRPSGPLGNPILLGNVLAATLGVAVARLAARDSDRARWWPAVALIAATTVATLSRGAWLAAAVGALAATALALASGSSSRSRAALALGTAAAPAALLAAFRLRGPMLARWGEGGSSGSGHVRASIARSSLRLWRGHPWLGTGPDTFGLAFSRAQEPALWRDEWIGVPVHAHSAPLQIFVTLGIAGAVAALVWIVATGATATRTWQSQPGDRPLVAALAAALLALCAGGLVNPVGLAGAATVAVTCGLLGSLGAHRTRGQQAAPRAAAIAAGLVALALLVMGLRELRALVLVRPAALQEAGAPAAAAAGRAARSWTNDDIVPRIAAQSDLRLAQASPADARALERAVAHARAAVLRQPLRAENHAALADVLAARTLRGEGAWANAAEAEYAGAEALAPANAWLLVAHARFELARRNAPAARRVAGEIVRLYPDAALGHSLSAGALLLANQPAEARQQLELAARGRWEDDAGPERQAATALLERLRAAPARAAGAVPPRP